MRISRLRLNRPAGNTHQFQHNAYWARIRKRIRIRAPKMRRRREDAVGDQNKQNNFPTISLYIIEGIFELILV